MQLLWKGSSNLNGIVANKSFNNIVDLKVLIDALRSFFFYNETPFTGSPFASASNSTYSLSFETALLTFHVATRPTVPQYLLYLVVLLFSLGPLGYPGMHASMTYSRSFTTDVSRAGSGCLRADHLLYLLIYFTSAFKLQSSVKNT